MPDAPDNQPPAPVLSYATSINELICEPMRSGRFVVVGDKVFLPRRCVLCNAEAKDPPLQLKMHRSVTSLHYEGLGELRLSPRRTEVSLSFCHRHLRRRRMALAAITILAIAVIVAAIFASYSKSKQRDVLSEISCLSAVAMMVGIGITTVVGTKGPRCHHFHGGYYYLEGFGQPFLQSLPEVPSSMRAERGRRE